MVVIDMHMADVVDRSMLSVSAIYGLGPEGPILAPSPAIAAESVFIPGFDPHGTIGVVLDDGLVKTM